MGASPASLQGENDGRKGAGEGGGRPGKGRKIPWFFLRRILPLCSPIPLFRSSVFLSRWVLEFASNCRAGKRRVFRRDWGLPRCLSVLEATSFSPAGWNIREQEGGVHVVRSPRALLLLPLNFPKSAPVTRRTQNGARNGRWRAATALGSLDQIWVSVCVRPLISREISH